MKLLNSFLIATQSGNGPLGSLYGKFDSVTQTPSLFWRSETGTEYNLGKSNGRLVSSSATYVYAFTGSNTATVSYTWNRLPTAKYIKVIAVGAGGGGGSGNVGRIVPATNQGGGGGGGGAFVMAHFSYSQIPSSLTVTLRAPGTGGFAQTPPPGNLNQPGFDGQAGGSTTFGSLVTASGGSGGGGGSTLPIAGALGGLPTNCTPNLGFSVLPGGLGGARTAGAAVNPALSFFDVNHPALGTFIGSAGGGNGGGFNQTAPRARNGSSGSSGYQFRSLITNTGSPGSASSGATGGNGADNLVTSLTQLTGSVGLGLYGLGGGGHGGGSADVVGVQFQSSSIAGGAGGNGGLYGAGGGGGGASLRPMNSGAGGTGSAGLCIVITYV